MSFLSNMVALADNLTKGFGLQPDVIYWAYAGADGAGTRSYAAPVARKAIVNHIQKQVRTYSGELVISTSQVVFLDPTVVNPFDKIVLPVGGTVSASTEARDAAQSILGTGAFVDASNAGILTEIYLGPDI